MQKEKERKAAMNKPVPPLPERELCDYEKMRDKNVRERQMAMAQSGFFEDLNEYKNKIGFYNEIQSETKDKKIKNNVKEIKPVDKIESKKVNGKNGSTRSKMIRQNMKSRQKNQDDKKKEHKIECSKNGDDKKEVEQKEGYKKEEEKKTENDDLETVVEIKKPANTSTTERTVLRETVPNKSDCYDDIDCFHLEY